MAPLYDLYQPGQSLLHRLDPRVKLLLAVCLCTIAIAWRNVWAMFVLLAVLQVGLRASGISRDRMAWIWKVTAFPMVTVAILWALFYPARESAWLTFWVVRLGPDNVAQGLAVGLRVGVLAWAIFSWLFTTDQATVVRSLVALGLPYEWGLVLALALRYLPAMSVTLRTISEAQQARGLDLAAGGPLARARRQAPILVAMIIASLRTAENVSRALESRALGAAPRRTYLHTLRLRRADYIGLAAILGITSALLMVRFGMGIGEHPYRLTY